MTIKEKETAKKKKTNPDTILRGKKAKIELSEEELSKVTGGSATMVSKR